jgi:hypothetical protein
VQRREDALGHRQAVLQRFQPRRVKSVVDAGFDVSEPSLAQHFRHPPRQLRHEGGHLV